MYDERQLREMAEARIDVSDFGAHWYDFDGDRCVCGDVVVYFEDGPVPRRRRLRGGRRPVRAARVRLVWRLRQHGAGPGDRGRGQSSGRRLPVEAGMFHKDCATRYAREVTR